MNINLNPIKFNADEVDGLEENSIYTSFVVLSASDRFLHSFHCIVSKQTNLTHSVPFPLNSLPIQIVSYLPAKMLFTNATIVTVDASRTIYNDGAILVQGNKIVDIGNTIELKAKHAHEEEIDLTGRIIIPGLISTHMHTAQTLLRGTADDLELVSWLCERIWVMQGNFTAEDGYAAARLSIAEMLLSGTTTFLESMVSAQIPLVSFIFSLLTLI